MEKKCCLNCKYSAYKLMCKTDPEKSLMYCIRWTRTVGINTYCEDYQKDSRNKE